MPNADEHHSKAPNPQLTVVAHMMTPGVVQIPGDVSVTEAAALLEREQMPCLLVKDTDTCFGLMTPTDIVKKVLAQGLEPADVEVRTIMTRSVHFIEYDSVVEDASTLMMSTGAPILIVTKQNQPVGVLTARDLVLAPKQCRTRVVATIRVIGEDGPGAPHQASIVQLSHVGAMLESPALLLAGTKVLVDFTLPDVNIALSARGTILNDYEQIQQPGRPPSVAAPGVDIQFTNLSSSDESHIKAWVLQNSPKSSDQF